MTALGTKLRSITDGYGAKGIVHWCPACNECHVIYYHRSTRNDGPYWKFDHNNESPTCSPSIRIFDHNGTICHYFLKAGKIEYCGDCRHAMNGQTVALPDWPFPKGSYGGIEE